MQREPGQIITLYEEDDPDLYASDPYDMEAPDDPDIIATRAWAPDDDPYAPAHDREIRSFSHIG